LRILQTRQKQSSKTSWTSVMLQKNHSGGCSRKGLEQEGEMRICKKSRAKREDRICLGGQHQNGSKEREQKIIRDIEAVKEKGREGDLR